MNKLGQWQAPEYGHRLAFAADGRAWAAGQDGVVRLFHDATPDGELQAGSHAADVRFSPDGKSLYAGPFSFDVATRKSLDTGPLPLTARLTSVDPKSYVVERGLVSPDGGEAVVAARFVMTRRPGAVKDPKLPGSRLLLLQARSFDLVAVLDEGSDSWEALAMDGQHLAAAHGHDIVVWDRKSRVRLAELHKQMGILSDLAFSPDGKYLVTVSAGRDHWIVVWDTTTWKELRSWSGDDEGVRACAFVSPATLVTGGDDHHVKLWSFPDGKLQQSLPMSSRIRGLAAARDRLAVAEELPGPPQLTLFELK